MKTPVSSEVTGLAERLRVAGHHTQAIVTNPFLTPAFGIDRGFCGFENLSMRTEALRGLGATSLMRVLRLVAPGATLSDRADDVREAAQAWLATPPREPFFLWVHFLDPHAPYGDRAGASTSLTLDLRALHSRRGFEEPFSAIAVLRSGEYRPSSEERARIVDLYRADVSFVDEQLVKLLDFLDARGLFERTVIVLTSDHGEEFWDHGRVEHGHSLHEEVVHVPLVLSLPGAARARVDHRLATAIDVAPTLARLAGLAGAPWPGSDLLIADPPHERAIQLGRLLFGEEWTGVRTPTTKYLRSAHGSERIFDLANDPAELHDRASAEPELLARLRAVAPGHAGAELAESDPAREGAPAATLAMSRASNPAAESGARRH
jgi:arylsulfatase